LRIADRCSARKFDRSRFALVTDDDGNVQLATTLLSAMARLREDPDDTIGSVLFNGGARSPDPDGGPLMLRSERHVEHGDGFDAAVEIVREDLTRCAHCGDLSDKAFVELVDKTSAQKEAAVRNIGPQYADRLASPLSRMCQAKAGYAGRPK
jgi:hypothetical protein